MCVHNMYILHIHYIYIAHTLHIHCTFIAFTLHIIYITYTLHIHYKYITYTLHVHYIYITYTLHIHYTYITYTLHVHYMYITYNITYTLHPVQPGLAEALPDVTSRLKAQLSKLRTVAMCEVPATGHGDRCRKSLSNNGGFMEENI